MVIKTKIPGFTGVRASVMFKNGVGETDNPYLIDWFKSKGYVVAETIMPEPAKTEETNSPNANRRSRYAKNDLVDLAKDVK